MADAKASNKALRFEDRAMSSFPVSIGTAMALETLFSAATIAPYDAQRTPPPRVDPMAYERCYIHLETLLRNLHSSMDSAAFANAPPEKIAEVLTQEIEVINNLFAIEGNGVCTPVYYYSGYEELAKKVHLGVTLREGSSPKQLFHAKQIAAVLRVMEKQTDSLVKVNDLLRPVRPEKALIITHHPYDLCVYRKFDTLDLLESHTGVLKPRAKWYSKYYPVPDAEMFRLPFHRKLLLVFGDRVQISPMPITFRRTVLETAGKRNWVPTTTIEKVELDLGFDIRDPYALSVFKKL